MMSSVLHRLNPVSASEEENPLWLVVLCDMMTNLMLFFLIMYGFTRQPEESRKKMMEAMSNQFKDEKQQTQVEQKAEDVIQKTKEEDVTNVLKEKEFAQVEVSEQRIRVTLTNSVLFVSGEAVLGEQARRELGELAPVLSQLGNTVLVEGHTDNVPLRNKPYASNWELSVARASAVVDFLTAAGLPAERFVVAGYGEYRPVAPNESPEGRSRNRRIEINILRKTG